MSCFRSASKHRVEKKNAGKTLYKAKLRKGTQIGKIKVDAAGNVVKALTWHEKGTKGHKAGKAAKAGKVGKKNKS